MPARASNATSNDFLNQPMRIKDQCHSAVAQNGGTGDELNMAVEPAEVLDHCLMVAKHLVHDEAASSILGLGNHDLFPLRPVRRDIEVLPEPDVWNDFSAHIRKMLAIGVGNVLAG